MPRVGARVEVLWNLDGGETEWFGGTVTSVSAAGRPLVYFEVDDATEELEPGMQWRSEQPSESLDSDSDADSSEEEEKESAGVVKKGTAADEDVSDEGGMAAAGGAATYCMVVKTEPPAASSSTAMGDDSAVQTEGAAAAAAGERAEAEASEGVVVKTEPGEAPSGSAVTEATADAASSMQGQALKVGAQIDVFWEGDDAWYSGRVVSWSRRRGHQIKYEDGDVRYEKLSGRDQPDEEGFLSEWKETLPESRASQRGTSS